MSATILIIDDDATLCSRLQTYFTQFDLNLIIANTPSEGRAALDSETPDILLLDVMLPEIDGFSLCCQIRQHYSLPIIMLTARGDLSDKVFGLENGADDYLAKPFEPRELVARIQVLLRRNTPRQSAKDVWEFEGLQIHPDNHKVLLRGSEVELTGMEFRTLVLLAKQPGAVLSREQLLNELKGVETKLFSRSIDILMSRLRIKLDDDPRQVRYIKTVRNMGYTFIAKRL